MKNKTLRSLIAKENQHHQLDQSASNKDYDSGAKESITCASVIDSRTKLSGQGINFTFSLFIN